MVTLRRLAAEREDPRERKKLRRENAGRRAAHPARAKIILVYKLTALYRRYRGR